MESFHDVINLIWLDLAGSLARLFGLEVDDLETLFSESDPYVKEVTQLLYSFSIRPLVKKSCCISIVCNIFEEWLTK